MRGRVQGSQLLGGGKGLFIGLVVRQVRKRRMERLAVLRRQADINPAIVQMPDLSRPIVGRLLPDAPVSGDCDPRAVGFDDDVPKLVPRSISRTLPLLSLMFFSFSFQVSRVVPVGAPIAVLVFLTIPASTMTER
jgi:hypothetical protein